MNKKEVDKVSGDSNTSTISPKDDIVAKKIALEAIIKRIDYHLNKNSIGDVDLYYLIKDFFREFLNLKYEFSLDELISELDKIYLDAEQREKTFKFINKVKIIEYHDSSFTEAKIREFIVEFSAIAKLLIKNTQYENKGFWAKLTSSFKKKEKKEEVDYYKHTHSNEQVDVPVPVPPVLNTAEHNNSLDSVTEHEFSSDKEKLEEATPDELSQYTIEAKAKKKKEEKQSKNIPKEDIVIQNPAKHYDTPVYRKSYSSVDSPKEKKSIENNNWDSEIDSMANEMTKQEKNKNNWAEPIEEDEYGKKENDEDINFDDLNTEETEEKNSNNKKEEDEDDDKEYNIENIAKNIEREKQKLSKKSGKKNRPKTKEKQQTQTRIAKNKTVTDKAPSNIKKQQKETKEDNPKKTELELLIDKAKKITKKEELMSLYKKINSRYESSNIETQAKFYKNVMDIYKRISKLK